MPVIIKDAVETLSMQHEGSEEPMDPAGWASGKAASGSTAEWEQHPPASGQGPVLPHSPRV